MKRSDVMPGWILIVLYIAASILIGRATVEQNHSPFSLEAYATGQVAMPYQARCMMAPVLRWAQHSRSMVSIAQSLHNSVRSPEDLVLQGVNSFCLIVCGWLVVRLRRQLLPRPVFAWLAPILLLWVVAMTFTVRYDQRLVLPYDFCSLVFFNLGLLACLERRAWLLLVVMVAGTYNRETTLFLLPIWLVFQGRTCRGVVVAALGLAAWIAVKSDIAHLYHAAGAGLQFNWNWNLAAVAFPHHWAQLWSVGGYLILPMWLRRDLIADRRLRMVWMGCVPFLMAALIFGVWNETRIFGELSLLIAATAAIQFEQEMNLRFAPKEDPVVELPQ